MEGEVRPPMDRDNLTGRHVNIPEKKYARLRTLLMRRQQKAVRDFPAEARIARNLLQNIQFDAIRAMFQGINNRASGITRKPTDDQPHSRVSSLPKAPSNSVTRADVFLVDPTIQNRHGRTVTMKQLASLNAILINLRTPSLVYLSMLHKKPRPLIKTEMRLAKYRLFDFYRALFHEMGHAYAFVDTRDRVIGKSRFAVEQSGIGLKALAEIPVEGTQRIKRGMLTDSEYWVEGFNELQTFYRMEEYLNHHSLRFEDIQVNQEDLPGQFNISLNFNSYRGATLAVKRVIEYVSETSEVPRADVFNAVTKTFQTKGGRKILFKALMDILGPELVKRIRHTPASGWDSDLLSHDILTHLKTNPKTVERLEDLMTRPGT